MVDRAKGAARISYVRDGVESVHFPKSPAAFLATPFAHRQLLRELVKRDALGRYRGSFLGLFWSFLSPLLMLAAYTLVFGVFLQARWAGTSNSLQFSVVLFIGLIYFSCLAECINRSPTLVVSQPNYVKKVVFPLELLPWVVVCTALIHALISLLVWCAFHVAVFGTLEPGVLMAPLFFIPLVSMALGIAYIFAAAGVFVRDVSQVTVILVPLLMFLSPVFYSVDAIPAMYRPLLEINPLTTVIEQARIAMLKGGPLDWVALLRVTAGGLVFAYAGFAWFQHVREAFADVL
jgi:lipopolysaccharide transport system permease protein